MKRTKFNAYLPIWFILLLPPAIILTLAFNGALSIVGLIAACIYAGLEKTFNRYTKGLFRTFIIAFIGDLFTVTLYVIPEFLSKNTYLNENLVKHLEYDAYGSFLSIIYMVFMILIIEFLMYLLIRKFITKKLEIEKKKTLGFTLLVLMFISPYMFYLPSNIFLKRNKSNLDDFKGTLIIDNADIKSLLNHINSTDYISSYVLNKNTNPYTLDVYIDKDFDKNPAYLFEYDSALIFNLISDINKITFHFNEEEYEYTINKINEKFSNIKKLNLTEINEEYSKKKYKNYEYLGHYKTYDIFNHDTKCNTKDYLIDTTDDPSSDEVEYTYLICGTDKTIYFLDDKGEHSLRDLLDEEEFSVWDLAHNDVMKFHYGYNDDENDN